jgi:hypothetical protein
MIPEWDNGRAPCPVQGCPESFAVEQGMENHLWEQYRKGEKAAEYRKLFEQVTASQPNLGQLPIRGEEVHFNHISSKIRKRGRPKKTGEFVTSAISSVDASHPDDNT